MMVKYEAQINGKSGDEFISADILIYDDEDKKIGTIYITDKSEFEELESKINNFSSGYITEEQLIQMLENTGNTYTINSTSILGMNGGDFVDYVIGQLKGNADFPPRKHDSTTGEYGLGNKNTYGHVKTVNNLTTTGAYDGEALSAYQGKVLNDKIESALRTGEKLTELVDMHGLHIRLGRRRVLNNGQPVYEGTGNASLSMVTNNPTIKDSLFVQIYCDKEGVSVQNRTVNLIINGKGYIKQTDADGRAWVDINIAQADSYLVVGVVFGFDNFLNNFDIKNMLVNQ